MGATNIKAGCKTLPGGRWRRSLLMGAAAAAGAAIGAPAASAQDAANSATSPASPTSIWTQDTLSGDWGGERTALNKNYGLTFTINSIDEAFAVVSGGLHQQASYEGRTEFTVDDDLQKLLGWSGATTHITVFQIRDAGQNAESNTGAIADPSNIDAWPTTRLFTAYYQQAFDGDRFSLRVGQLAADDEFMISQTAGGLINSTWGWPSSFANDLPSGGPAYPLATPGIRAKFAPTENITVLSAVFSGDPAGAGCTDPNRQKCDAYGTQFSFSGGAFAISELQYAVNQGKNDKGLPGTYKLGFWYHTADFADEFDGLTPAGTVVSLANPAVAAPLFHEGNFAFYGIADQTVWRAGDRSLNLFVRASGSPADRNLISYYVDGGAGFTGFVPGRKDDVLTLGTAYEKISPDVSALDSALGNVPRDNEWLFEASYTAQVAPWWTVQPDVQYFIHPNGGQNPINPALTLHDAFLAGIRSTIKF